MAFKGFRDDLLRGEDGLYLVMSESAELPEGPQRAPA